eukprot:7292098-Heterocapsa_arctica.AAC.1
MPTQRPDPSPFGAGHLPGDHPIHLLSTDGDAPARSETSERSSPGGTAKRPRPGAAGPGSPQPASAAGQSSNSG